jgi:hypothetical protein
MIKPQLRRNDDKLIRILPSPETQPFEDDPLQSRLGNSQNLAKTVTPIVNVAVQVNEGARIELNHL